MPNTEPEQRNPFYLIIGAITGGILVSLIPATLIAAHSPTSPHIDGVQTWAIACASIALLSACALGVIKVAWRQTK
jgi:hypothetical protein